MSERKKKHGGRGGDPQKPATQHEADAFEGEVADGGTGIAGIAGTGGSSGTGSARGQARALGDISGIDPEIDEAEIPPAGSIGKGKSAARTRQQSDGGLPGRTRGPDGETVPNQKSPSRKGEEGQRPGHQSRGDQS